MLLEASRSALRALRVNKLRSALTMLGIVIGVGAVIAMIAVGAGAEARIAEQIQSLGPNVIVVTSRSAMVAGVRAGQGSRARLTEDDAAAIQREVTAVQAAAPIRSGRFQAVHDRLNWGTEVMGVTPEWFQVKDWNVVDGRPITAEDHQSAAKVVVVGQTVVRQLFGDQESPLGQIIRIRHAPFRVVGVLDGKGQSPSGQDQDDILMVPLATARRKLLGRLPGQGRTVWSVSAKIVEGQDLDEAEAEIRELMRQRHRLRPDQDDDFDLRRPTDAFQVQEEASRVMTYLLGAIASVSLLVGGVGIMNIMLVCVTERTREIGLRMAVGARGRDILTQFLVEAVTLSLTGGAVGIAAGIGGARAISYFAEWETLVAPAAIGLAFGIATAVGIVFGFYPARRAARLDPIAALRYE
jgi:putative ABC transport system permease protein